jgi:hypothetical protein
MCMVRQDDPGVEEVQVVGRFSVAKRLLEHARDAWIAQPKRAGGRARQPFILLDEGHGGAGKDPARRQVMKRMEESGIQ